MSSGDLKPARYGYDDRPSTSTKGKSARSRAMPTKLALPPGSRPHATSTCTLTISLVVEPAARRSAAAALLIATSALYTLGFDAARMRFVSTARIEIVGSDDAVERGDVLAVDALYRRLGDRTPQRDERRRLGAAIEPVRRLELNDERHTALREQPRELQLIATHEQRRTRIGEQARPTGYRAP